MSKKTKPPPQITLSPTENLGVVIFSLPLFLCSLEMIPGWSVTHIIFGVTWPPVLCYSVMVVCGAIGGCLFATGYRIPGIIGGILAGLGGLSALSFVLERSTVSHTLVMTIVVLIGSLPGMGLGLLLKFVQDLLYPPLDRKATFPEDDEEADNDRLDADNRPRQRRHRDEEDEEEEDRPRRPRRDGDDSIRRRRPRDEDNFA
jgi:hypothetical protein